MAELLGAFAVGALVAVLRMWLGRHDARVDARRDARYEEAYEEERRRRR